VQREQERERMLGSFCGEETARAGQRRVRGPSFDRQKLIDTCAHHLHELQRTRVAPREVARRIRGEQHLDLRQGGCE
jgi:hypothetical protein